MTMGLNHSKTKSTVAIDLVDGAAPEFLGELAGLDADNPGEGLFQPKQVTIWSGQSGGLLLLARNWPGGVAGPLILADGDDYTGEVMRITPAHTVGVGGETAPANLMSIKGDASVGWDYSRTAAPANGMIVEGKVGIGTANPQAQLAVSGAAAINGDLSVSGNATVTGTLNCPNTIIRILPAGDISMGVFTTGSKPR